MAALLNLHLPRERAAPVGHLAPRTKIRTAELAADAWRAAAQVLVFLWAILALAFLSVLAGGILFA